MKVEITHRGGFNLLLVVAALTFGHSIAIAYFMFAYMPSRARADAEMAELLRDAKAHWSKTRVVYEKPRKE